jgi:hypothetical protein
MASQINELTKAKMEANTQAESQIEKLNFQI